MNYDWFMDFITPDQHKKLLENDLNGLDDPHPVVMLHMPGTPNVWLLTHVFTDQPDVAFGLVVSEDNEPEMTCIWLYDLFMNHEPGRAVVPNNKFHARFPVSHYKVVAEEFGALSNELLNMTASKVSYDRPDGSFPEPEPM